MPRIFLIDRKVLGIGGICIGNIYDDRQDLAVLIPVTDADPVISYFNELWALGVNKNGGSRRMILSGHCRFRRLFKRSFPLLF